MTSPCRAAGIALLAAALAAHACAQTGVDPIPAGVPLTLTPLDFDFVAFPRGPVDQRTVSRTFALRAGGSSVRLLFGGADIDQPDDWVVDPIPDNRLLRARAEQVIVVRFQPQQERRSRVLLRFVAQVGGAGNPFTITLQGEGRPVPPPAPPAGTPTPPPGTPPTPTAPAPAADPDEPPAALGAVTDVCLKFWLLPGTQGRIDRDGLQAWVRQANRIFWAGGARVRFVQAADSPGDADRDSAPFEDEHCLDVYVGEPGFVPDDEPGVQRKGITEIDRTRAALAELERLRRAGTAIHPAFEGGFGSGLAVRLERDGDSPRTLAHELGHALGLGAGRPVDHLDPTTGKPIDDTDRLMRRVATGVGTGLTPTEAAIASAMAQLVKGGPRTGGCRETLRSVLDPPDLDLPSGDLRHGTFRSEPGGVRIGVTTATPIPSDADLELRLEADLDRDGAPDLAVRHRRLRGAWSTDVEPPTERTVPPPGLVDDFTALAASGVRPDLRSLRAELPRALLGDADRRIGLRASLQLRDGATDVVPDEGFVELDLTRPLFVLALDPGSARITAAAGEAVELAATLDATATFVGDIALSLRLSGPPGLRVVAMDAIPHPAPERLRARALLPADLPPGEWSATLLARCTACGAASSANLVVAAVDPSDAALPGLTVLLLALVLAVLFLRRALRGSSTPG